MKRLLVSILLALTSTASFGLWSTSTPARGSEVATEGEFHEVTVSGKTLRLPISDWAAMDNPTSFAVNFEARAKSPGEAFPEVLSIFLMPMSKDRKTGERVSETEWVEAWVAHAGKLTVRIRVDRGRYWIMSRQTFDAEKWLGGESPVSRKAEAAARKALQPAIDATRAFINMKL